MTDTDSSGPPNIDSKSIQDPEQFSMCQKSGKYLSKVGEGIGNGDSQRGPALWRQWIKTTFQDWAKNMPTYHVVLNFNNMR